MATDLGEQFRAAMRRFPSTVSVISTAKDGQRHGMTATAVTSVSLNPPSLLVCVNRSGRLFGIMESCHRFCVNVLHAAACGRLTKFCRAKLSRTLRLWRVARQ